MTITASSLHYFPLAWPFLALLAALFGLVVGFVGVRIVAFASVRMGIGPRAMLALLLFSLLGSYVNIPIAVEPAREVTTAAEVSFFGMVYVVPVVREWPATVIAINLGGAIIPILLSGYLVVKTRLYGSSLTAVALVAAACYQLAQPVPGVGIAIPVFVPAAVATVVALLLSRKFAAPLAYIGGSLGTLIGADLLNLDKIQGLGAPVASIGGAGTFDGIFLTGLAAVVYASLVTDRDTAPRGSA